LPEPEKNMHRRPVEAKTSAEFVWFAFDPFTKSDRLLEKYPRPATENADEVARTWYESNKDILYLKADLPRGKPREPGDYKPFEEVVEHAKTAGIAYQCLLDWYNDVKFREEGGDHISLYSEGSAMGLGYRLEAQLHTLAEWEAAQMLFKGKGPVLSTFQPSSEVQKLLPEVFVDTKGLFIGRLIGKEAARVPEFAEVQDKVREGWIKKKKGELARAKLDALAAKFPEEADQYVPTLMVHVETDDAKFLAAAKESGLEVKTQDWFDASAMPQPGQNSPFFQFLRRTGSRYGKTVGTISPAELSSDQASAWMGRIAAKRDPDLAKMTPLEYQSAKTLAGYEARGDFLKNTFLSDEFLKQQYGLELEVWRKQKEEPASVPQ
jgi:hypothetical protein